MNTKILIQNRQRKYKIGDEIKNIINNVIEKVLEHEEVEVPIELSIVFVNNNAIKELNQQYRDKNKPTDVLSFPMFDPEEIKPELKKSHSNQYENLLLGDIIISLEKAEQQANEYGHSFEREIGFLVTHGMYHLLGYDHEIDSDRIEMRRREEKTLKSLGLTRDN